MTNPLDNTARRGTELSVDQLAMDKIEIHQLDFNPVFTFTYSGNLGVDDTTHRLYNDTGSDRIIKFVRASVGVASIDQSIIVDVKMNGASIFDTILNIYGPVPWPYQRLMLPAGTHTITSTPMPGLVWGTDDYLTVSIQQIGTTFAGADLTINVVVAE